jgi:hypothetical protein
MTSEDVKAELEKDPFTSFRIHLVSGKTIDVRSSAAGGCFRTRSWSFRIRKTPWMPAAMMWYRSGTSSDSSN